MALENRVAIVTGGRGAVGGAIARRLAALGARVVLYDQRACRDGVAAEVGRRGLVSTACGADIADPGTAASVVDEALRVFGRIDVLVNAELGSCLDTCLDEHLRGTMHFVEATLAPMRAAGAGRIVNLAGGAGLFGARGAAVHAAAAAGVIAYSKSVSQELSDLGIQVNVLAPIVRHPVIQCAYPALDPERYDEGCVAAAAAYLCGDDCAVTGAVWTVGGGRIAQAFVAAVPGYFEPYASPCDIGANLEAIVATDHAVMPRCAADELLLIEV
jgi:NAD(P)-dependent dehydrogenase (short-subunit alcohol dehydrogenase family)